MTAQASNIAEFPNLSPLRSLLSQGFPATGWLARMHVDGLALFERQGLPTSTLERWKYTNFAKSVRLDGRALLPITVSGDATLVSANEFPDWARDFAVRQFAHAADMHLVSLDAAILTDGIVIDVADGQHTQHMTLAGDGTALHPIDLFIRVGANATLTLVEDHSGVGAYWKNQVTRVRLAAGARLSYTRILDDSAQAVHSHTILIEQDRDSVFDGFTLVQGGRLTRMDSIAHLNGPGAHCGIDGVTMQRGTQHSDTTSLVEHRAPNCTSNQSLRTVLDDQAHGVYQGKVHVYREAQKTDGYQLSNALLLSEGAEMDTKPELEIYADDVKCSHGATTGQLDDEPLFYMRTRGIPEAEARAMLIESFLQQTLSKITDDALRDRLGERVSRWLDK